MPAAKSILDGNPLSSWLTISSDLFGVHVGEKRFTALNLLCEEIVTDTAGHRMARLSGDNFQVDYHIKVYEETTLVEMWQIVRNVGREPLEISRIDSFSWTIPDSQYDIFYYTSDWGQEFEPVRVPLSGPIILETRYGRSSKGQHPWFALFDPAAYVLSGSIAWSGNWIFRFEPLAIGGYRLSGGLHDWNFAKVLLPGKQMESPHAILVSGSDLNAVSQQYTRAGRRYWYLHNSLSDQLPVEWNHWFSYEDADINEAVFSANASESAKMGIEVCTLDAGWFGPNSTKTEWHDYRGDWNLVNQERFPRGLRALSDESHALNIKFGLWCEIEGLGKRASLTVKHPELAATTDGQPLSYICFGNPQAQEWAYETLCHLISTYNCDWIKLDFNVDPGAGCTRMDHGHGAKDGLYDHYIGYYRTLERVRQTYPHVLLENCSSGGLRIDLGMARHTHMTFLSDTDWPVHDLQIFWGASTMLAPNVCLHWSYSDWRGVHPQQKFNPHDPMLQRHQLDYYTRISMLGWFGLCQKLPELPDWVKERLTVHAQIYQKYVRRFVREADLYRLTNQPKRDGSGDRWCAFQYSLLDDHLLFVFRLPGGEPERTIYPYSLQANRTYCIQGFEGESLPTINGQTGITFKDLPEEGSALLRIFES